MNGTLNLRYLMQPLNSQSVHTVTILTTLTVSDLHVLFYIFLSFIGKCVICTILTCKFSYIFLAYSTLCLTGNIAAYLRSRREQSTKDRKGEFKCKANIQMCFERDCTEHIVILRWKICSLMKKLK
jgi:hypothetical protein